MKKFFTFFIYLFALILIAGGKTSRIDCGAPQKNAEAVISKGNVSFTINTDKNPLTYKVGETVKFNVRASLDNKPIEGFVKFRRDGDDGGKDSGIVPLVGGKAICKTKITSPGFARMRVQLLNADKQQLVSATGKERIKHILDVSAGANVEKTPQMPEPKDFDAFWQKEKQKLAAVPLKVEKVLIKNAPGSQYFDTYAVSVDCAGPRPMTGFLQIPKGAKRKSLPVYIYYDGYGLPIPKIYGPKNGKIALRINAHGTPLQKSNEFYNKFFAPLKGYALKDGADPETCYFNGMVMRVLRSLQYAKTLPEWDGKNLVVNGTSQGGLQSLWAAGLDNDVSGCVIAAPWGCNIGAETIGLLARLNVHIDYYPALGYYDAVHHAKRIQCPVEITRAGLGDLTCPPTGVASVYNNIKTTKSIIWYQGISHVPKSLDNAKSYPFEKKSNIK